MKALWLTLLPALLGVGCSGARTTTSQRLLRVAMIPSTDPGKIIRESQPLVNYLEKATGSHVEFVVPTNYAVVVEAIANDKAEDSGANREANEEVDSCVCRTPFSTR